MDALKKVAFAIVLLAFSACATSTNNVGGDKPMLYDDDRPREERRDEIRHERKR